MVFLLLGCSEVEDKMLFADDYRVFRNTPAWNLAVAVEDGDTFAIKRELLRNPDLINYQEPMYGNSLLMMTVRRQKKYEYLSTPLNTIVPVRRSQIRSFKFLLTHGANPNLQGIVVGETALMLACVNRWNDQLFIEELLKHKADPNIVGKDTPNGSGGTALQYACASSIDFVRILLDNGADVNIRKCGNSVLLLLLESHDYETSMYLIRRGFDCNAPIGYENGRPISILSKLRKDFVKLGSCEHKKKQELIKLLSNKGIDYYQEPIPQEAIEFAQKTYSDRWRNYLDEY